jgi:hypothetical protein
VVLPILMAPNSGVGVFADLAVGLLQAGRRRNVEADFELIDEVSRKVGENLEAAHAEIGAVRRNRRQPAEITGRERLTSTSKGGVGVDIPSEGFRRIVDRKVDVAVPRDLAARGVEGKRVAFLVLKKAVAVGVDFRRRKRSRRGRDARHAGGARGGGISNRRGAPGRLTLVQPRPEIGIFLGEPLVVLLDRIEPRQHVVELVRICGNGLSSDPHGRNGHAQCKLLHRHPP